MAIASCAQTQNEDRESNMLVALGDRIVQSFVNANDGRYLPDSIRLDLIRQGSEYTTR
jgi:hypothetical protein